jgi:hypothetical protein
MSKTQFAGIILDSRHPRAGQVVSHTEPYIRFHAQEKTAVKLPENMHILSTEKLRPALLLHATVGGVDVWIDGDSMVETYDAKQSKLRAQMRREKESQND